MNEKFKLHDLMVDIGQHWTCLASYTCDKVYYNWWLKLYHIDDRVYYMRFRVCNVCVQNVRRPFSFIFFNVSLSLVCWHPLASYLTLSIQFSSFSNRIAENLKFSFSFISAFKSYVQFASRSVRLFKFVCENSSCNKRNFHTLCSLC